MDPTTRLEGQDFDDSARELVENLSALRMWFVEHGPEVWVRELDRDLDLLSRNDAHGFDRFLSHFGSMGSIGDAGVGEAEAPLTRAHLLATVLRSSLAG